MEHSKHFEVAINGWLGGRRRESLLSAHILCARIVLISIGLLWVSGTVEAQGLARNCTPIVWQTDGFVAWVGDAGPQNGIDDLIDASPNPDFDIVVNFNDCVEDADIAFLNSFATVEMRLRYISSVLVTGATKAAINSIVANSRVAFVELQPILTLALDVSVPNIQVSTSAEFSPNTVEDLFPGIDGTGVGIAIFDSGVDNMGHDAFNATTLIAGFHAPNMIFQDPIDDVGHGTHVASIALGQANRQHFQRGGPWGEPY